jgi:uncharacterized protein
VDQFAGSGQVDYLQSLDYIDAQRIGVWGICAAAAQQRAGEAGGAEVAFSPYVPTRPDHNTPYDLVHAPDYYLTPRRSTPTPRTGI